MQCYENTVTNHTFGPLTDGIILSGSLNDEHACPGEEQETAKYAFQPMPWNKAAESGPEQGAWDRANQKITDEQRIDCAEAQV